MFDSFARLDSRISSVGQTAAKIGDHLQFNGSPGDLMELSPLFSDDSRVAEAASIAQKLSKIAVLC
nr:exocyst complex component SEC10 [Ipomoea batatas]GMD28962.1 exocyst complex component SEC10 [Ipomoea batatas]